MIRSSLGGLARVLGFGLVLLAIYLLAAAIGGLVPGRTADLPASGGDEVEIGLLFGPIHVDLLLPTTPETRALLRPATPAVDAAGAAHLIVGWGARDFYTTAGTFADITPQAAWRAVTGDASVLRVDVIGPISPDAVYPRLRLSQAQYAALLQAISDTGLGPALPGAGFTSTDGFLEAEGRFHIFRTCNTWVSSVLRAAGVEIGAWTPTPYALRLSLWRAGLG